MYKILLLFIMLYCHILDDYKLQGILASLKQREWWEKNESYPLYKNDYKMALWEHAFCWAFSTTLPVLVVAMYTHNLPLLYLLPFIYIFNTIIHAYVDNLKANKHSINLVQDQICHFIQVFGVWFTAVMFM